MTLIYILHLTTAIGTKAPKLNPIFSGEVFLNATDLSEVHFKTGMMLVDYIQKMFNYPMLIILNFLTLDGKEGIISCFFRYYKIG